MNKIYKIVWSRTKHCYVVASEFAKGHTKSSASKNNNMVKLGVSLALMAVLGSVGTEHPVQAATTHGSSAEAKGTQAVALGDNAKASANQAIAIGGSDATLNTNFTRAAGNQSIAIGGNVRVGGYGTIGIGGDDLDTFAGATDYNQFGYNNWIAGKGNYTNYNANPTYGNGDGAVFVGVRSIGSGHGAVALGALSQASKNVATALGMGATADKVGSVALGTASHTTKDAVQVSNVAIKGTTYSFAGSITSKPGAVVSVGNNTVQRQIINVAPGAVSATSTDAINGSQLYAVANNITKTNVAVGSNNLTLAVNDTTNTNGTIAYTVDLSQTAKTAIADVPTIKTNLTSTAAVANQAKTDAATAQRTANTAVTNASTAQTIANAASTAAANVKITAEAASTAAAGATSKAEAASTVAATASNTAAQAKTTADTAATNANVAKKDASDAKQAANTASSNANTALQTANTANTNANTALTKANTAVQTINVGTSPNSGTVALNNTNNRLNLVGVGSVTTAVSGTNAINIGLTSSAESAIKAVPSISTAVTRIDSTVGSLSTTMGTVSSAVSGLNTTMNNISTAVSNAAGAVQEFTVGANKDGKTGGFKLNKTNFRADFVGANDNKDIVTSIAGNQVVFDLSNTAKTALSSVASISTAASTALSTANSTGTALTANNTKAQEALDVAKAAKSTAEKANSTASDAKSVADKANSTATQANSTASEAKTTAERANNIATQANSTASDAKTVADKANSTATAANSIANTAKNTADAASTVASTAQGAADKAQSTANTASTAAGQAQSAADKAQSTANTASTAAGQAQSAADKAQGTADAAKQVANTAVQTITVGTDTNHKASGVALTKDNNRLDIVGLKSVSTAVSGNSITVGLTEAAESSIAAVPSIQTSVTDLTSKVGGLTSTVTTLQTDLGTVQQDLGTVKNEWNTVKNSATNSIQSLQIGAGANSTPITLDKNNTKVDVVGADNNARIMTTVDATNKAITVDLSDSFKKQINNLENTANGSSITYVTKDGDKVVKIGDTFYPEGTTLDKDGNPVDETGKPAIKQDVKPEDIKVTVGDDTARQIGNVASGIDGTVANGKPGADGATPAISATEAKTVVGGANGKDGLLGKNGTDLNNVATIKDLQAVAQAGLDFAGDRGEEVHRALSNKLTLQGGVANDATLTDGNIGVITNDTKDGLLIKLNKDIKLGDTGSVKAGVTTIDNTGVATNKVTAGNTSLDTNGVITAKVTTGSTTVDTNGISTAQVTITDGAVLSATGMDMKGDAITGLKAGENDTDAVNYSQLKSLENKVADMGTSSPAKLVDGEGNEVVKLSDGQYYPVGTELKDGKAVDKAGNEVTPVDTSKTPISAATNTPNSGLSIQLNESTPAIANDGENGANTLVGGMVGADGTKSGGLLQASGKDLGKVATIGDLQVVAQAGLNFVGDTENVTVHRPLSDTLAIKGGIAKAEDLTDNNIGVVANEIDGLTVKLAKNIDLGADGSLSLGKDVSLTPDKGLSVEKEGNKAVYGPEGTNLTDKAGNTTVTNAAGATLTDKDNNINVIDAKGVTVTDGAGNSNSTTATQSEIKDQNGNTNTSTATKNELIDAAGNSNTSTATENKLIGENGKEASVTSSGLTAKDGDKKSSLTAEGVTSKNGDKETVVNADGITTNGAVVATDTDGNTTTINGSGMTITPKEDGKGNVSLTKDGLDNGGNKLKNVAAGTESGDVVNFDQYKELKDKVADMGTNSPSKLVDNAGNEVVKIGDQYYPAGTEVKDGKTVDNNGAEVQPIDTSKHPISAATNTPNSGLGIQLNESTPAIANGGENGANTLVGGMIGEDGTKSGGLLQASGNELGKLATLGDLQAVAQAGLNFVGDTENVTVHRPLSDTLAIKGGIAKAEDLTDNNIGVVANEIDGLTVKLAKNIDLGADGSLSLGKDVSLTPDKGLSVEKEGNKAVYGPEGTNLTDKAGNSNSTTATQSEIKDQNGNTNTSTATKNELTDAAGNSNTLTADALTTKGADGKEVSVTSSGLIAKDGDKKSSLTAEGVTSKNGDKETVVNADGITTNGAVVVTDTDGNTTTVNGSGMTITPKEDGKGNVSLTKDGLDNGGNKLKNVAAGTESGDVVNFDQYKELKDKVADMGTSSPAKLVDGEGNEVVKLSDGQYYPVGTEIKDGKAVDKAGNEVTPIDTSKTPISAATNTPNSGLGLQVSDDANAIANDGENGANVLVGGKIGADGTKSGGLLQASGKDLGKVATIGDLQVVAQAGLNFVGDTENVTVHRPLSDTLAIKGGIAKAEDLTDNNIGVVANETDGLIVKLAKNIDLGADGSLSLGKDVSLTPDKGLSVEKEGNKAVYGPEGTNLTDKAGNITVTNAAGATLTDKDNNTNVIDAKGVTVTDKAGNSNSTTATQSEIKDQNGNTNTSTATKNELIDAAGNSNTLTADALTTKGADGKEVSVTSSGLTAKDGDKKSSLTAEGVTSKNGDKETVVNADGITTNGAVVATDTDGNTTTVNGSGMTITPKEDGKANVSLTKEGLDNGGNRLQNVGAAEKSGDAVNYNQFKELERKFSAAGGMETVDEKGNKVIAVDDKVYKVDAKGNPMAADGMQLTEVDGKYYNPSDVTDGKVNDGAKPADSTAEGNTSLSSNAGSSGLGLAKVDKDSDASENRGSNYAKAIIGGADGTSGLLGTTGSALNKITTVQDLQVVAQAGLDFGGDTGDIVHRPLSTKLTLTGGVSDTDNLTNKNIGVVADGTAGLEVKLAKNIDLTSDGSLKLGDKVSLDSKDGLTIKGDNGNSANYSGNGLTLIDDKGNSNTLTPKDSTLADANGNTSSMKPEGIEITDKEGNKTTVDANGISLQDKEGNIYVTINKDGLGGKDGEPVDFKNGINVPGTLTVTPATKDTNGNTVEAVIDAHGNRIQNVGNGVLASDAANMGQLESVRSDAKNHSNNVGSMTAALAALNPLPYIGGEKGQIMAGVGVYENKQAVALGYAYTPNSDQQYTLGLSYGEGGKTMANMGATFRIGSGDGAETLAEHIKAQTSKEYEVKLADVKAQSDAKISDLQSQVEELRQLLVAMKQA